MIGLSDLSGLNINLQIPENFARYNSGLPIWGVSRELKLVVFRQVQECLANIHRHSAAKNAVMRIERANDNLAVEVSDDGKGMSAEKLIEVQSAGSGVGIGACASGCAEFRQYENRIERGRKQNRGHSSDYQRGRSTWYRVMV